jgi:hypothetical protein
MENSTALPVSPLLYLPFALLVATLFSTLTLRSVEPSARGSVTMHLIASRVFGTLLFVHTLAYF